MTMTLHDKLKKARESLGKNQKKMATAIGSGYRSWQAYEQGSQVPGGKVFAALANHGFNTHWFFTDDPSVPMLAKDLNKGTSYQANYKQTQDNHQTYQSSPGDITSDITDAINIQELLNMTAEVLVSNTLYRPALSANIKAFHRSIALEQDNKELKNRVEKIEARLLELEKETVDLESGPKKPEAKKKPLNLTNTGFDDKEKPQDQGP